MALNFPSTPNTNDIYTYSGNSWIWNGYAWDSVVMGGGTGAAGATGVTGAQGIQGATGATGPVGDYVISFNGLTGAVAFSNYVASVNGVTGAIVSVGLTSGKLSQFASTTSAELFGVISNPSGSGSLVFSTGPTFTTSINTSSASFNLFNANATSLFVGSAATTGRLFGYTGVLAATQSVTVAGANTGVGVNKTVNIGTGSGLNGTVTVNVGQAPTEGTGTINLLSNTAVSGTLSTSGNISAPNIVNSFNGSTGAVSGASLGANTFTGLNTFNAGIGASGASFTGTVTVPTPTNLTDAANKSYVDSLASGINWHQAVTALSDVQSASTYVAGATGYDGGTGVGAYIEANANGALTAVDSVSVVVGNRLLMTGRTNAIENGIYTVTSVGSVGTKWKITRATDMDGHDAASTIIAGDAVYVTSGTDHGGLAWIETGTGTGTGGAHIIGTDGIVWTQFTGTATFTAGAGLTANGRIIDVNVDNSTVEISSDILRVKDSGITNAKLANSNITVTAGNGLAGGGSVALGSSVTLTNAGVTAAVAGTGISVSGATGSVTITNTGVQSFNGLTGAVTYTTPLASASVTGVASFGNEFVVSAVGAVGLTSNYVKSVNGLTGAIVSVAVTGSNIFTGLQTMNAGITSNNLWVTNGVTFGSGSYHTGLATFAGGLSAAGGATFSGTFSGATATFSRLLTASGGLSAGGNVVFNAVSAVFGASAANTTPITVYKDNSTDNPAVDDGFGSTTFDTPNNKVPLTLSFTEVYDPNTGLTASTPGSTMIRVRDQTAGLDTFTVTDLGDIVCTNIICNSITPASYGGNLSIGEGNSLTLNWNGNLPIPTVLSVYNSNTEANTLTLNGDGTFSQLGTTGSLEYGAASVLNNSFTLTTGATGATTVASFTKTQYRSFEFDVQGARGTTGPYQFTKILAVHDGTTVTTTQLSNISTGGTAGTYTVDISGTLVRLRVTPGATASTVFKTTVKAIPV